MKLHVLDDVAWQEWRRTYSEHFPSAFGRVDTSTDDAPKVALPQPGEIVAAIAPRGWGPNAWLADERTQTHLPRRFVLVGTTVDEGRIWDVLRAVAAVRETIGRDARLTISGRGPAAAIALYSGLFASDVSDFELIDLAADPHQGPVLIGIQQVLAMPEAVALAFPRVVELHSGEPAAWDWPREVAQLYGEPAPLRLARE
ncbi:MAG: hypothetical protein K2Y37_10560 [Pirellulales bacterium]|nr:hypothetical protein [Pirellulales bacterium]